MCQSVQSHVVRAPTFRVFHCAGSRPTPLARRPQVAHAQQDGQPAPPATASNARMQQAAEARVAVAGWSGELSDAVQPLPGAVAAAQLRRLRNAGGPLLFEDSDIREEDDGTAQLGTTGSASEEPSAFAFVSSAPSAAQQPASAPESPVSGAIAPMPAEQMPEAPTMAPTPSAAFAARTADSPMLTPIFAMAPAPSTAAEAAAGEAPGGYGASAEPLVPATPAAGASVRDSMPEPAFADAGVLDQSFAGAEGPPPGTASRTAPEAAEANIADFENGDIGAPAGSYGDDFDGSSGGIAAAPAPQSAQVADGAVLDQSFFGGAQPGSSASEPEPAVAPEASIADFEEGTASAGSYGGGAATSRDGAAVAEAPAFAPVTAAMQGADSAVLDQSFTGGVQPTLGTSGTSAAPAAAPAPDAAIADFEDDEAPAAGSYGGSADRSGGGAPTAVDEAPMPAGLRGSDGVVLDQSFFGPARPPSSTEGAGTVSDNSGIIDFEDDETRSGSYGADFAPSAAPSLELPNSEVPASATPVPSDARAAVPMPAGAAAADGAVLDQSFFGTAQPRQSASDAPATARGASGVADFPAPPPTTTSSFDEADAGAYGSDGAGAPTSAAAPRSGPGFAAGSQASNTMFEDPMFALQVEAYTAAHAA